MYYFIEESRSPADTPIFTAVSTLSPVKTQTFIPEFFMNVIVSATSSYSLSSIAVDPINSKFFSILPSHSSIYFSLLLSDNFAA
jgi:hypothetical protein